MKKQLWKKNNGLRRHKKDYHKKHWRKFLGSSLAMDETDTRRFIQNELSIRRSIFFLERSNMESSKIQQIREGAGESKK